MCVVTVSWTYTRVQCVGYSRVVNVCVFLMMESTVNTDYQPPVTDGNTNEQSENEPLGVLIKTNLSNEGVPTVLLQIADVKLALTPEAMMNIALHGISASYAARAEQALFKYAMDNCLDPQQLIKLVREL